MKTIRPTLLAALAAANCLSGLTVANAQTAVASSGPTRAEVLADLQVWRSSGLAPFEVDPSLVSVASRSHQSARARYEQLRSGPEFQALVRAIAAGTGEAVPQRLASTDRQPK